MMAKRRLYSDEERANILAMYDRGVKLAELASMYGTTRHNIGGNIRKWRRVKGASAERHDPEQARLRNEAFNREAHRLHAESGGLWGWPEHEWHDSPDWSVRRLTEQQ